MQTSRYKQWFFGLAAMGMAAMAGAQAVKPLRIGLIGPLSGPSADFGVPMMNGAKLALDEINIAGGYLGRSLELLIRDDAANPAQGMQHAQELVKEQVVATIGFCNTGVALKSLEVFQAAKSPLIVPCATGTPITTKYPAPESYIFRTSASDAIQAPFVVADILARGWNRVAVFADNTGYGEAGLQDVLKALAAKNLKPVHVARFDLGVKDLEGELRAAQAAQANVVFSYTVGAENAVIARGRQSLGWKVPQVGAWPLSFPFFMDGAKEAAEGALMAQTFIAEPSNERRSAFLSAYARKYNTRKIAVPMAAAQAYDSVYLLVYGLLAIRDGDLSGPAVKTALENLPRTYYGVTATHQNPFSKDDKDAVTSNMLVMGVVKNGAVTFAYTEDRTRNLLVQRKR